MRRLFTIAIPLGIILIAFLLMRFFLGMREDAPRRTAPPRELRVNVAVAQPGPLESEILAYGRLRSALPLELTSEVAGILERGEHSFRPGRRFSRGDILLRVDERPLRLDLASNKSELLSALAGVLPEIHVDYPDEIDAWQDYFDAFEIEEPLAELPQVKNERIKLYLARFRVYNLFYAIRDLEIRLEKHQLRAPFDGIVVAADLREGSIARVGSRLGSLLSFEEREIELSLPVKDLDWIRRDAPVRLICAEQSTECEGRIIRVGGAIDEATQTLPIYLALDRQSSLPEGSFLEARIPGRRLDQGLRLPQTALSGENEVFLIKQGRLTRREVVVARREDSSILVSAGLAAGDSVVVDLLQGVTPGMPARALGATAE